MTLTVKHVHVSQIHPTWLLVEDLFIKAAKQSSDYTLEQIKSLLVNGSWVLLVATDEENVIHGAAAINFYNMPNYRVGFIVSMAGKAVVNKDVYEQICSFIKANGASRVQCTARESAARLYKKVGMEERHVIMETKL
jgi:O-methyltransferase involved in polyketide biosynthesis